MFKTKIAATLLLFAAVYFAVDSFPYALRINTSHSLPERLLIAKKAGELKRESFAALVHPTHSRLLLKKVAGLPGDPIEIVGRRIFVNKIDCGEILAKTQSGVPIHPIALNQVPAGHVFVHAPHPQSFDSRYEEFGVVPFEAVKEELWPIF